MHHVLILGAGKIGALIAGLLAESGQYDVSLADQRPAEAAEVVKAHGLANLHPMEFDATDDDQLGRAIQESKAEAIISGLPHYCNGQIARAARRHDIHYFDLTEDIKATEQVLEASKGSSKAFAPQCGLAPGFISIAANELIQHFDSLRSVKLRVGALPQHPNNVLKYALNWSTEGLINEYGNPCHSIVQGKPCKVLPLEGLEEISIDGRLYEAFNTSGGLGSLAETYQGQVHSMDYKTIRYPGHCEQMRLLMNGLKMNNDRETLKQILENAVPLTLQDVVIVYVAVTGYQDGALREENYVNNVYPQVVAGRLWSAIQITTAAGLTAVVDIVLNSPEKYQGFVRQEQFRLTELLDNSFGRYYRTGSRKEVSAEAITSGTIGRQRITSSSADQEQ